MSHVRGPQMSPKDLEEETGYRFRNPELLEMALFHHPAVSAGFTKNPDLMEPLATLGETILDTLIATRLYERGDRERGTLTPEMVRRAKHARSRRFGEKIPFRKYIRWEDEEGKSWAQTKRAPDTVFKAFTGAVYLDARRDRMDGMEVVREMLERWGYFGK